jgi:hypothetical protein
VFCTPINGRTIRFPLHVQQQEVEQKDECAMEDHKLQALHDTLSKLRGRHGLGTSSLYSWQRNPPQGAAAKAPPSVSGGNPLRAHFHREGQHPHRSLARGDGDGRAIKRNFDDLEEPNRPSPVGEDGRKSKKKRKDDGDNDKRTKEEKKMEKKAALKAAKLEMKRLAKLEEKRREKREAKAKQEESAPPPRAGANGASQPGKSTYVESQPSPLDGGRSNSKEKKRKAGKKKKIDKKEKKRRLPEEQSPGESSSPANLPAQAPPKSESKKKKKMMKKLKVSK